MRKRNKQINIRLTESEYLSFTKKAELSNLTLQDFVIQSCSNKEIHVIQGAEDLASIRAELKKTGNNINQIAKKANIMGVYSEDIELLLDLQSAQQSIVSKLYYSFFPKKR